MELLLLALRRLVAQGFLTAAMVCAFAFSVGALVAGPIFAAGADQAVTFGYMRQASPLSKDVFVESLTSSGFDRAQATRVLRSQVASLRVARVVFQEVSGVAKAFSAHGSILSPIAYRDHVFGQVDVVQGRDPTSADEVLLPQSAATALGVGPGMRVRLRYSSLATVTVAGIYSVTGGGDPLLFGQDRLLATSTAASVGSLPMLTTLAGFTAISNSFGQTEGFHAEWGVEPDFAGATPSGLRSLATKEGQVASAVRAALGPTAGAVNVTTKLASLIPGAERAVSEGLAPTYLVAFEVALVGLGVLIGVASVKLGRQSFELAVLKTRGARMRELVAMQSAEAVMAAVLAFPLALSAGFALALVARAAHGPGLPGAPFPLAITRPAVLVAVTGIGIGALVLVVASIPHLRRSVIQERRHSSREGSPAWLRLPYETVPLVAGALALAELRRRGINATNGSLDPLVLAAPTLLLLGGAMLAVRLLFWVSRKGERLADGIGSPAAYLALHRLPRSTANMSLALLLVLATGLFAFAGSLRTTILTRNQEIARQQVGADWSLLVGTPAQTSLSADRLGSAATMAFYGSLASSSNTRLSLATVIGVDPCSYPSGGWWRPQDAALPLPTLLGRLRNQPIGIGLVHGSTSLEMQVRAPAVPHLRLSVVLEDPNGTVVTADLGTLRPGSATYLAPALNAARLLSIVVQGPTQAPSSLLRRGSFGMTIEHLSVLGSSNRPIDVSGWRGLDTGGAVVQASPLAGGGIRATFRVIHGGPIGGIAPADPPLPVLVGGVSGGSPPSSALVQIGYLQVPVQVVGTLRAFPAATTPGLPFIVMPVRALAERFQQITQSPNGGVFVVLGMGEHDPAPLARRAGFHVLVVSSAATIEALLASRQQNLAIGMEFAAAVAGVLLAVLALGLAVYFGGRRHEYEFSSFRALGGRLGNATTELTLEYGLVLLSAMGAGYAVGAGLLVLVLSFVAPRVGGVASSIGLLIDWQGILVASTAAVATLGGALLVTTRRMGRLSTSAVLRGEPE